MMSDVENMINNELFSDTVDTLEDAVEQHRKRKCPKGAINKGKVYLLDGKKQWTHERVAKANNETTDKTYAEYKQRELKMNRVKKS